MLCIQIFEERRGVGLTSLQNLFVSAQQKHISLILRRSEKITLKTRTVFSMNENSCCHNYKKDIFLRINHCGIQIGRVLTSYVGGRAGLEPRLVHDENLKYCRK